MDALQPYISSSNITTTSTIHSENEPIPSLQQQLKDIMSMLPQQESPIKCHLMRVRLKDDNGNDTQMMRLVVSDDDAHDEGTQLTFQPTSPLLRDKFGNWSFRNLLKHQKHGILQMDFSSNNVTRCLGCFTLRVLGLGGGAGLMIASGLIPYDWDFVYEEEKNSRQSLQKQQKYNINRDGYGRESPGLSSSSVASSSNNMRDEIDNILTEYQPHAVDPITVKRLYGCTRHDLENLSVSEYMLKAGLGSFHDAKYLHDEMQRLFNDEQ